MTVPRSKGRIRFHEHHHPSRTGSEASSPSRPRALPLRHTSSELPVRTSEPKTNWRCSLSKALTPAIRLESGPAIGKRGAAGWMNGCRRPARGEWLRCSPQSGTGSRRPSLLLCDGGQSRKSATSFSSLLIVPLPFLPHNPKWAGALDSNIPA